MINCYNDECDILNRTQFDQLYRHEIQTITGLNASFCQQAQDVVLRAWKSYEKLYEKWEKQVSKMTDEDKISKMLEREPSIPQFKGKVPVWIDIRTGEIEKSRKSKFFKYFIKLRVFDKWVYLPLNCADYHVERLESGKIKSFQLVKRKNKWYCYVAVEYEIKKQQPIMVKGVDLGIKRCMATVLLKPNSTLTHNDFDIIKDRKRHLLNKYNKLISQLQRNEKWRKLRRLRHKRANLSKTLDREVAKELAEKSNGCLVVVGYPKYIKYQSYRGDGNKKQRKLLHRWSYGRIISYIKEECEERGVPIITIQESWTSKICHKCHSTNTIRQTQSEIRCLSCGMKYNADFNASINIGTRFLGKIPCVNMLNPQAESLYEKGYTF
jgi:IS605 OrfB family transposase